MDLRKIAVVLKRIGGHLKTYSKSYYKQTSKSNLRIKNPFSKKKEQIVIITRVFITIPFVILRFLGLSNFSAL